MGSAYVHNFKGVGILIVLVGLSGCTTLHVTAEHQWTLDPAPPQQASQIYMSYQVDPYGNAELRHYIPAGFHTTSKWGCHSLSHHAGMPGVRRAFEESFAQATYVLSPNPRGIHVNVEVALKLHPVCTNSTSLVMDLWHLLAVVSVFTLPFSDYDHGYIVRYHLHNDGALQRTYRYEITQNIVEWLPLAFFIWANRFTPGETDAFEETARRFVADAARDRYY